MLWKTLAVAVMVAAIMAAWLSHARGQETNPPTQPVEVTLQPDFAHADGDVPRRIARDFAPWIHAVILQKPDVANRLFRMRHVAQEQAEAQQALKIFRKFPKLDGVELTLVGGRTLGEQTGVLLFTVVSDAGPVAFKVYHYRFGNDRMIGRLEITDDWNEIERMYTTIDPLQTPVTVQL